ncbi:hypothetical protein GGS23DRAFT_592429 [Durotheca rogersii]|uniref:uncharacterized protein n=1 Tax=Durotheca rogersii TaxID=419775 RepID=UPI0022202E90|nr:uncharacterized protein GGS23DRAFT_592429 [Durotheca rogersii]KAI5868670.1 hypothetical protein GGS23DRAFT_592429 [Durotheca rogersii]
MCQYGRTVFACNHSQVGTSRVQACTAQQEFESGQRAEPCEAATTHALMSVRVPRACVACAERKAATDRKFEVVRHHMLELRGQLERLYDGCVAQVEGGGEAESEGAKKTNGEGKGEEAANGTNGTKEERNKEGGKGKRAVGVNGKRPDRDSAPGSAPDAGSGTDSGASVDPVAEFLRKKRMEPYAHLMMFSDYLR